MRLLLISMSPVSLALKKLRRTVQAWNCLCSSSTTHCVQSCIRVLWMFLNLVSFALEKLRRKIQARNRPHPNKYVNTQAMKTMALSPLLTSDSS